MNKLALAALAAISLTAVSTLPAFSQAILTYVPNNNKIPNSPTYQCDEQIGYLKRVHRSEVAAVDDGYRVWVTELCPTFGLMRSEGNAAYLRTTIAENDVLTEVLQRRAYSADDVFAVRMMGDGTIALYVHRFGR
ncbi:MAG: hypothetical protein IPK28_19950 [Devosia sp.]|nr:hypothetical protein [Devosia sp.]